MKYVKSVVFHLREYECVEAFMLARAGGCFFMAKSKEEKAQYAKSYYQANKEQIAAKRKRNKEREKECAQIRRDANREDFRAYGRAYYATTRPRRLASSKAYNERNKEHKRAREKARYEANKEQASMRARTRRYDIETDAWEALYNKQRGLCTICHEPFKSKRDVHTDHNHATGKFRGLLCSNCNKGIGFLQDDIQLLRRAIKYLVRDGKP